MRIFSGTSWTRDGGGGGPVWREGRPLCSGACFPRPGLGRAKELFVLQNSVGAAGWHPAEGREGLLGMEKRSGKDSQTQPMPEPRSSLRAPGQCAPFPTARSRALPLPRLRLRAEQKPRGLLISYRFKRSPFKELISDLSSLIFWDSRIQLVDVVA